MSDEPTNGSYVSWRELTLVLKPINAGLDSLDGKVDQLLLQKAVEDGAKGVRKSILDSTKFWIALITTMTSGTIASVITVVVLKA